MRNAHLKQDDELAWSPVVANNRMNRSRVAEGINSYQKEFGFSIAAWMLERVGKRGSAAWADVCAGEGLALQEVAKAMHKDGPDIHCWLQGVDLLPPKVAHEDVHWWEGPLLSWKPDRSYDLISCSHGLHYVGDKLAALSLMAGALSQEGLLLAHLDLDHVLVEGKPAKQELKALLKASGFQYDGRKRLVRCEGRRTLGHPFVYLGADDAAGPNWTGQEAVASHYAR